MEAPYTISWSGRVYEAGEVIKDKKLIAVLQLQQPAPPPEVPPTPVEPVKPRGKASVPTTE